MSKWNHSVCDDCWKKNASDVTPYRIKEEFREEEVCCTCGAKHKSGIYMRGDPNHPGLKCGGVHGKSESSAVS
jgi:hypothetical protein